MFYQRGYVKIRKIQNYLSITRKYSPEWKGEVDKFSDITRENSWL